MNMSITTTSSTATSTRAMRRISPDRGLRLGRCVADGFEESDELAWRAVRGRPIPVTNEIAKPTRPIVTQVVPKPMCWLITIVIPMASTTPLAGAKSFSPTNVAWRAIVASSSGSVGALGSDRESREEKPAADPEHGDADVDELEDAEPGRRRIRRLEGEEKADSDEREEDGRIDPAGLAVRSLRVRCGFHARE